MEETVPTSKKRYVVMLIFGLTMLAFSTWIAYEYRDYRHEIESTTGTVTKILTEEMANGLERRRALIEFTASDGKQYDFRIPVAGTFFDYTIGEKVTVVYDPAAPGHGDVDGFWPTWTLIMLCFVLSYLTILFFMWAYYSIRYRGEE